MATVPPPSARTAAGSSRQSVASGPLIAARRPLPARHPPPPAATARAAPFGRPSPHQPPPPPQQLAHDAHHYRFNPTSVLPQQLAHDAHHYRFNPTSVLPLLSASVEAAAELSVWEQFAGRSAMVGCVVALALEFLTQDSIFTPLDPASAASAAALLTASIAAAAAAAAAAARPAPLPQPGSGGAPARPWWWLGAAVHEAVVSSLTAARGSASGVTGQEVDELVTFVLERTITKRTHPVFGPLQDAGTAASTVTAVLDSFIFGEERADLPQ
ncbi:hypothetical protein Rsub_09371 [Raphidocelis subcapitata]|uniref:Uncharacterized protein n=1 Tax=Raphidocelis subcapitata TaxID=307507 RepID=A0A2V0PHS9_9CHLO|nr:hypothetical protein Rsub_09371 [Raphidocelis subcapitata]|eukprot:GBF96625.1 hypothetical protein Rsub_09371 [Raphidocelis subcapitata]